MNALMRNPNCAIALSGVKPKILNIFSCSCPSWIRRLPPPTSIPLHTKSYAFALTLSGCSSSSGMSSGFGIVNGWCVAMSLCSSSLHSKSGKSTIQRHSNLFLSFSPSLSAISSRRLHSCVLVLFALSPLRMSMRSPGFASAFSTTLANTSGV